MLIDEVCARPGWAAAYSMRVRAPRARAYDALREADFGRSPIVRTLLAARGMRSPFRATRLTLDSFLPHGFVMLREQPGAEVVLGLVGRFWTARGGVRHVEPAAFAAFHEPGYAKVAWNFAVREDGDGCVVSTETRVVATDADAARKFGRYWFVIKPFSGVIRREMLAAVKRAAESRT